MSIKEISDKYQKECETLGQKLNQSLVNYLKESASNDANIIIFRGNDKLNFNSRLNDQDFLVFCASLQPFAQEIMHLDLSYNNLTDASMQDFKTLLQKSPELTSVNLQGNSIESEGAQLLSDGLKTCQYLEYLNLEGNNIKTDGAMCIAELLFSNNALIELNLSNNYIGHDGIIGLTSVLNWNNSTLKTLVLDAPVYSSICQETAIHFAKMLQSNRGIEKLSLQKHNFTCDAIYTMTEHLLENPKLRVLDLTSNKISFKGCEALCKYLSGQYCALESLNLSSNRTGHYGAKAIAKAISKNRSLIHLDMTRNDIDDNGLRMIGERQFFQSMAHNDVLVSVKLYWNHFGQDALRVWHKLRTQNESELYLDFTTYIVDTHFEMALVENDIPYATQVKEKHYNFDQ